MKGSFFKILKTTGTDSRFFGGDVRLAGEITGYLVPYQNVSGMFPGVLPCAGVPYSLISSSVPLSSISSTPYSCSLARFLKGLILKLQHY